MSRVIDLVRLRATHPAFDGRLKVTTPDRGSIRMTWKNGPESCRLDVDLATGRTAIDGTAV